MEKVSIKQPVLYIFSNSRSLEQPGLIIETLEYVFLNTYAVTNIGNFIRKPRLALLRRYLPVDVGNMSGSNKIKFILGR